MERFTDREREQDKREEGVDGQIAILRQAEVQYWEWLAFTGKQMA